MTEFFKTTNPNITDNRQLREPQREGFLAIEKAIEEKEIGIVLPVGCGKSGLIALTPFAYKSNRVLIIAPYVKLAEQLHNDFDPTVGEIFYHKRQVIDNNSFAEPVLVRGTSINKSDLDEADVVVANIQQLQGENNRWLTSLPDNYFDLILFDEAHHNVAESWDVLRKKFPNAKIVNYSATPCRADGKIMSGKIVYSYSIFDAIQKGYAKELKALMLNPATLRYVRIDDETKTEIEVSREEVLRLGEDDANFRRSIVTSSETLNTIVDASIRELKRIRELTQNDKHKIIASALNYRHCQQIVAAYQAKSMRVDYVHSRREGKDDNEKVLDKLNKHELDVIVQVRKLGEGFDHPYLSVAAIFSIFSNLSPFVQFVGRIMRVVDQNNPNSLNNKGTVIFHAGSNIASKWSDFQNFSGADKEYFQQLLPLVEETEFATNTDLNKNEVTPRRRSHYKREIEVKAQEGVVINKIPLIVDQALEQLIQSGLTNEEIVERLQHLRTKEVEHKPLLTPKVKKRQADRKSLDNTVKIIATEMLEVHNEKLGHRNLSKSPQVTNLVFIKKLLDRKIAIFAGKDLGERFNYSQTELNSIFDNLDNIADEVEKEVFPNG